MLSKHPTTHSFPVEVPRDDVLRLLGVRSKKRTPRPSLAETIDRELDVAQAIISPRAIIMRSEEGLPGSSYVVTGPVVAAVCTIGDALEHEIEQRIEAGNNTAAMVLDAIGSAAVEHLADRCNHAICTEVEQAGETIAARRSPGYSGWDLAEQKLIWELVGPTEIGVTLTDRQMMVPRKSVSFIAALNVAKTEGVLPNRCSRCGMKTCEFRK